MIIFEDKLELVVNALPPIVDDNSNTFAINFDWGTEEVLAKYLTLKQKASFPLIWLVESEDINDLREPNVKRTARIIILNESQAPEEFNKYQHEYDFKRILQPICDNLLNLLQNGGISRIDDKNIKSRRVKNYSMREVDNSLVYTCNAIVLDLDITFHENSKCIINLFN